MNKDEDKEGLQCISLKGLSVKSTGKIQIGSTVYIHLADTASSVFM